MVKTNNGRMTPEHIDVKLLKALAEKPAGVRELSRITGTDLTVVLRHVHALKEDLRIRRLVPDESRSTGSVRTPIRFRTPSPTEKCAARCGAV